MKLLEEISEISETSSKFLNFLVSLPPKSISSQLHIIYRIELSFQKFQIFLPVVSDFSEIFVSGDLITAASRMNLLKFMVLSITSYCSAE